MKYKIPFFPNGIRSLLYTSFILILIVFFLGKITSIGGASYALEYEL